MLYGNTRPPVLCAGEVPDEKLKINELGLNGAHLHLPQRVARQIFSALRAAQHRLHTLNLLPVPTLRAKKAEGPWPLDPPGATPMQSKEVSA